MTSVLTCRGMKLYSEPGHLEIKTPDGSSVLVLKELLSSFTHNELTTGCTVLTFCPTSMPHFQRLDLKGGRECTAFAKHWQIFSLVCPIEICSMID